MKFTFNTPVTYNRRRYKADKEYDIKLRNDSDAEKLKAYTGKEPELDITTEGVADLSDHGVKQPETEKAETTTPKPTTEKPDYSKFTVEELKGFADDAEITVKRGDGFSGNPTKQDYIDALNALHNEAK